MKEQFTFDREKFLDIVHFICHETTSEELGNVKLHKILYYADMLYFTDTGKPLTGVEYLKQSFGPTARHLSWATKQLETNKKIHISIRNFYGYQKKDFVSLDEPKSNKLNQEEKNLILSIIDFVCSRNAKEISEMSHNIAWETADLGEVIPYVSAHALWPIEVTDEDIEWGEKIAQDIIAAE